MHFESFRRPPLTPNLTALVDVVFILVIFLVLAATFQRPRSIDVSLPESEGGAASAPTALRVVVHPTGSVQVEGERVALDELGARLSQLRGRHEALVVVADEAVRLERAVAVLGHAVRAGFQDVAIATEQVRP